MFINNIFNKYQAGFLPGHSSVYQLIETYDSIVKAIEKVYYNKWFESYLNSRSQRVFYRNILSDYKCLHAGGPQGYVLHVGPLLFLI